jgi:hypothetical protein
VAYTQGFRNARLLRKHLEDHAAEVGAADEAAYLEMADEFLGGLSHLPLASAGGCGTASWSAIIPLPTTTEFWTRPGTS